MCNRTRIKELIINNFARDSSNDGAQEAVVIFETDSAAKTALLLTNALIVDRPITVIPHTPSTNEPQQQSHTESTENITNRTFTAPDHERVCIHISSQ
jgi:hypothetical protein